MEHNFHFKNYDLSNDCFFNNYYFTWLMFVFMIIIIIVMDK